MMTAANLCTDTVAEAEAIDSWFPHIRSWIASLEAPAWRRAIDTAAAARGDTDGGAGNWAKLRNQMLF